MSVPADVISVKSGSNELSSLGIVGCDQAIFGFLSSLDP